MDHKAAAKAREAGEEPPPEEDSPPVSKKCFMFLVFILLTGGIIAIVCVLKSGNGAEAEDLEVTTTAKPTTVPIEKLTNDDEVLARCKNRFTGVLGKDPLAMISTGVLNPKTKVEMEKGAFWLRGIEQEDKVSFKKMKVMACKGFIPTVVIQIRPQGYKLILNQDELVHYDGDEIHEDWLSYDAKLKEYQKVLKEIPALIIMEPKLLQLTFNVKNLQYNYENGIYIEEFLKRAQQATNALKKSWIYIDAGDPEWLSNEKHLEHVAITLTRVQGIRGFAMNTGFFANMTYTEKVARKIACRTDLQYVVDSGRNGGEFSHQELSKIAACRYDPPDIKTGNKPMWGYGVKSSGRRRRGLYDTNIGTPTYGSSRGWSNGIAARPMPNRMMTSPAERNIMASMPRGAGFPVLKNANVGTEKSGSMRKTGKIFATNVRTGPGPKMAGGGGGGRKPAGGGKLLTATQAKAKVNQLGGVNKRQGCFARSGKMKQMDATIWARRAGESDGRILSKGTFDHCLLTHSLECDGQCGLILSTPCTCSGTQATPYGSMYDPYNQPFHNPYPQNPYHNPYSG